MAQSFSNTVKFGVNTRTPSFPAPSFKTKTSTPSMLRSTTTSRAFPAFGALGVQPTSSGRNPGALSSTMPRTGTSSLSTGAPQVSTSTPQYGSAGNSIQSQMDSIRNGIAGAQGLLDQRTAAEAAAKTAANTKTGGKSVASDGTVTFKGILNSLLGASKPTDEQNRARKEMERIAAGNKAIADEAKRTSDMYGQEIARVGDLKAGAVAGNLSTGSQVVGSGNANLAANAATTRMDALAAAQKAALEGTAQQLTGQEQQANAFKPSLEASLIQQQQQIGGLGSAGGLAAPLNIPYSAGGFDPITGQQIAGGLGGYAGYNAAQQAFDLTGQYPDAGVQYDPNLSPQENLQRIQQALGGSASYQRGTFGAAGANSYIGGAQLGAAGALTGQAAQIQTQGAAADANFNLMLDIMKRGQINDLNQPALNQLVQSVSRGLASDTDVVAFRSALQTVRSQYAAILGGGSPTDATQAMAAEKIPDTVSLGALQEVEKTMRSMVSNTVAAYNQTIGAYSGGGSGGGGDWSW